MMNTKNDDRQRQQAAIDKTVARAAFRQAQKLSAAESADHAFNKKIALIGFAGFLLVFVLSLVIYEFSDDPEESAFSFEARVTDLYAQRNEADGAWPPRVVGIISDKHGEMKVGVETGLYPKLKLDDRVEVGYFDEYLPFKYRVLERLDKSSP